MDSEKNVSQKKSQGYSPRAPGPHSACQQSWGTQWVVTFHSQEEGVPTTPRLWRSLASPCLPQEDPGTQTKLLSSSSSNPPFGSRVPASLLDANKVHTSSAHIVPNAQCLEGSLLGGYLPRSGAEGGHRRRGEASGAITAR